MRTKKLLAAAHSFYSAPFYDVLCLDQQAYDLTGQSKTRRALLAEMQMISFVVQCLIGVG